MMQMEKEEEKKKRAKISGEEKEKRAKISGEEKEGRAPWWTQQFSNDAVRNLQNRFGDEREPKASLYLQLASPDPLRYSWLEIVFKADIRYDLFRFSRQEILKADFRFDKTAGKGNKELAGLTEFGCAVWKYKIIIVGGTTDSGDFSKKVHIYDTLNKRWENTSAVLQVARGNQPHVVVAGDRVFVFDGLTLPFQFQDEKDEKDEPDGGRHQKFYIKESYIKFYDPFDRVRMRRFCEYFDFDSSGTPGEPKYLPCSEDQQLLDIPHNIKTRFIPFAFYPNKSLILISASPKHIVSFGCYTFKWNIFLDLDQQPIPSKFTPILFRTLSWDLPVALLEDFLFWVDHSTIYALDLHKLVALPVYTFPCFKSLCPQFETITPNFPFCSRNRSLHPVGKDMLCLIGNTFRYQICFATFKVKLGMSNHDNAPSLQLILHKVGCIRTCSAVITNSFTISKRSP